MSTPEATLANWIIYVRDDEEWVSIRREDASGDTSLRMPYGWKDKKQVLEFVEALAAYQMQVALTIHCDHNRMQDDFADDLWEYIQHGGKTWNRCTGCGLLELWEGGQFFKAVLPPDTLYSHDQG